MEKKEEKLNKNLIPFLQGLKNSSLDDIRGLNESIGYASSRIFTTNNLPKVNNKEVLEESDKTLSRIHLENKGRNFLEKTMITSTLSLFLGTGYLSVEKENFNVEFVQNLASLMDTSTDSIYGVMSAVSGLGLYLYKNHLSNIYQGRMPREEKIGEYSDDIASNDCRNLDITFDRSDSLFYIRSLEAFGGKDGLARKTALFIVKGISELTSADKAFKKFLSNKIFKNDEEKSGFYKLCEFIIPKKTFEGLKKISDTFKNQENSSKLKEFVIIKTKDLQSGDALSYLNDSCEIIGNCYQEALKRNVKRSLIFAIKEITEITKIENDDDLTLSKEDKNRLKKAKEIVNDIFKLSNRKIEVNFDDYQAISEVAKKYQDEKIEIKEDSDIEAVINNEIGLQSQSNALRNFKNFIPKKFKNDFFDSKDDFEIFRTNLGGIYYENYKKYVDFDDFGRERMSIDIHRLVHKLVKDDCDKNELIDLLKRGIEVSSQTFNAQNIKNEASLWNLIGEHKKDFVEFRNSAYVQKTTYNTRIGNKNFVRP
jgi:hypothetical protein